MTPWSKHAASLVPDGYYTVPLDCAAIVRPGTEVTILTYGTTVYVSQVAAEETGIDAEVIDLRSLWPLDLDAIVNSVKKTRRCVVVHEATRTCGFGAELIALVQEHCFHYLEAPIERVTGWDTPYPHAQEWAYFPGPARSVAFSVPTGNFGDIFAGYLARNMGLPISQLIVATNRNDILHRFMSGNQYVKETLHATLSPSMDIMVSSNFERLLFDLHGRNGAEIAGLMDTFKQGGGFSVEQDRWTEARKLFDSLAVDDAQTCETIADVFAQTGEVLDPHTAIGVKAGRECRRSLDTPMVVLGTAHPVKFPEAVEKAGVGKALELPAHLTDLFSREEKCTVLPNDLKAVQAFVSQHGNRGKPL